MITISNTELVVLSFPEEEDGDLVRDGSICKGVLCFKHAFLIITGVTLAGALVSLVLVWRTRNFYKGDIYAKFKVAPVVAAADGSDHYQGGETVEGTVVTEDEAKKQGKNKKLQEVNDDEFK